MFNELSRVEKTKEGCRFYTRDIIVLDHEYRGDMTIDIVIRYVNPGFGILLAETDAPSIFESSYKVLFRIGDASYSLIENGSVISEGSFTARPDGKIHRFRFNRSGAAVWLTEIKHDEAGDEINERSGTILSNGKIRDTVDTYKIGFYSSAGNTLVTSTIQTPIPDQWIANVKNGNGGRLFFEENKINFNENDYDSHVETQNILLDAGTYYLSYKKTGDITAWVNPVVETKDGPILDYKKSLLEEDGKTFNLKEAGKVNLKFEGTDGAVSNIFVSKTKDGGYVPTTDGKAERDGSMIRFDMNKIKEIKMTFRLLDLPEYKLTEDPPYFITRVDEKDPRIVADWNLSIGPDFEMTYKDGKLKIGDKEVLYADPTYIDVLYNVGAIISKLVIVNSKGKRIDVITMDSYRYYVTNQIKSPLIVVHTDDKNEPLELSAAYREVIKPVKKFDTFYKNTAVEMTGRADPLNNNIIVYGASGIKKKFGETIEDVASSYVIIEPRDYEYDRYSGLIQMKNRDRYNYIIVEYNSAETFKYFYTPWERELFAAGQRTLSLEYDISEEPGKIIVFGIPKGWRVFKDYLYRVPNEAMVHGIDLFCDYHETLHGDSYTVNYRKHKIYILPELLKRYDYFIVDYLKKDSYAINEEPGIYAIDISTDTSASFVIADIGSGGEISAYGSTDIAPKQDSYIVLSRRKS